MKEHEIKIQNFSNALLRLQEAIAEPRSNNLKIDGCIKRFEFTYEACKKALEAVLAELGIIEKDNTRELIRKAGGQGFISGMELWDDIRKDRNDTTHEYDDIKAAEIYSRIPSYAAEFKFVLEKLKKLNDKLGA